MRAAWNGHTEIVRLLLEAGAEVNGLKANNNGMTALMRAAEMGHTEIARLLLEAKAEVNAKTHGIGGGDTALYWAEGNNNAEVAALLRAHGADGWTELMVVAREGRTEAAQLLLEAGAEVNAKKDDGRTALMIAARHGHTEIARLLLEAKAEVNAKDNDWYYTAPRFAEHFKHPEIVALLRRHGADGWSELMVAAYEGDTEAARLLSIIISAALSQEAAVFGNAQHEVLVAV